MTIATFLRENGVPEWQAWIFALSGKGWWRLSGSPQAAHGMPNAWFDQAGLSSLALQHAALNRTGNRRDTQYVRPVV
jgi:RNA-directed DNA polymerase